MPVAKMAAVRSGSSRLTSFSTPIARLTSASPESTSFHAPWKAKDAVAQPPSTLIIGTRSGNKPFLDQRREGHLAADAALPPLAHAAVAEPGLLDQPRAVRVQAAVEQQIAIGPAGQVLEGLCPHACRKACTRCR